MTYPVFKKGQKGASSNADGRFGSPSAEQVRTLSRDQLVDPVKYVIAEEVSHAINAALILGMPLLVTGEPGTGKTELGRAIAYELNAGVPLRFDTKSTSLAKDLFYTFDVLGRYGARDLKEASNDPRDYITYHALGRAILNAFSREDIERLVPASFKHEGPKRSVVIIDEVDKAPRDFPNDLLNEIEHMAFRVPELGNLGTPGIDGGANGVPPHLRPVVVITSNSEKGLPDPFLRRCVYIDIAFPAPDELREIVAARLPGLLPASPLLADALELFSAFRTRTGAASLHKPPGTAELLNWLQHLRGLGFDDAKGLRDGGRDALVYSLGTLIKTKDDKLAGAKFVDAWLASPPKRR